MDVIGNGAARRELLGAGNDDAVVALFHDAGIKRRVALLMRGF